MPPIQKDYSEKKLQQSHEIQIILFGDDCKCRDITKLKTEKSIGYWKMFINFWLGKYLLFTIELHSLKNNNETNGKNPFARRIDTSRKNTKGKGVAEDNPNPMVYQRT